MDYMEEKEKTKKENYMYQNK